MGAGVRASRVRSTRGASVGGWGLAALFVGACATEPTFVELPNGPDVPGPGEVVITEFMREPTACDAASGQYIEVINLVGRPLDFGTMELGNGTEWVPLSSFTAEPRSLVVLAPAGASPCHGFVPEVTFAGGIGTTSLSLRSGKGMVDEVSFAGWQGEAGRSWSLDGSVLTAAGNDDPAVWCPSEEAIVGTADFGSPGRGNGGCAVPVDTDDSEVVVDTILVETDEPVDTVVVDTVLVETDEPVDTVVVDTDEPVDTVIVDTVVVDTVVVDTFEPVDTGPCLLTVDELVAGDLVITEFLPDPVDCDDFMAEYIELFNPTRCSIDVTGLTIGVGGLDDLVHPLALVPPRSFVVARYTSSTAPGCYGFGLGTMLYSTARMASTGPVLRVGRAGFTIDQVALSGWAVFGPGVAAELDPSALSAAGNDLVSNWCPSQGYVPGGTNDRGTPGLPNGACLP